MSFIFVSAFQEYLLSQKNKKSMPFQQKIKDTIKKYYLLRPRTIVGEGECFRPNTRLYAFFDGVAMSDWSKIIQCILKNNLT